jgi:GNAT superfamily N-acetyltransferase
LPVVDGAGEAEEGVGEAEEGVARVGAAEERPVEDVALEPYASLHQAGFAALVSGVLAELGFALDPELDADLARPEVFYDAAWVAVDAGQVVGSVAVRRARGAEVAAGTRGPGREEPGREDDKEAELKRMYLWPAYRGRGLGRRLLALALDWARSQGFRSVRLDTGSAMVQAQRFYEAAGFEPCGSRTEVGERASRCEVLYRLQL